MTIKNLDDAQAKDKTHDDQKAEIELEKILEAFDAELIESEPIKYNDY